MTWILGGELGSGYTPPLSPGIGGELIPAPASRTVFANPIDSLEFGLADVAIRTRFVNPEGISTLDVGVHAVADFFQHSYPVMPTQLGMGVPLVQNWRQEVRPFGESFLSFGAASVEREREAFPVGFESLSVGIARIADRRIFIRTLGQNEFDEHGVGSVFNKRTFSFSQGIGPLEFGNGSVYNLRQFCDLSYPAEYQNNPVSQLATVTNRNKTVRPDPIFSERIGFVQYRLGPPPVQPDGVVSLAIGQQFVSHRVREVQPVGFNQLNTGIGTVYNAARDYTLPGLDSLSFGSVQFAQGPQGISTPGINSLTFGTQWVSDGARRVSPSGFDVSGYGVPWVSRSPRSIVLDGMEGSVGGRMSVRIPPTLPIATAGRNSLEVGLAFVRNRNAEVRPFTWASETHGLTAIDNRVKYVNTTGVARAFGSLHLVEFTLKTVRPQGVAGVIGAHDVRAFPQLPFNQTANLFGIDSLDTTAPFVTDYTIRPNGISSLSVGQAVAREMAILPQGIFEDTLPDSRPEVISYQLVLIGPTDQYPLVQHRGIGIESWDLDGAPRVSPHTIWMTNEAPAKAKENHPPGDYDPVEHEEGPGRRWIGRPEISNFRREVFARPADWNGSDVPALIGQMAVGQAGTLFVYPSPIRGRIGFLTADGGDKSVSTTGFDAAAFGLQNVRFPDGVLTVASDGLSSLEVGNLWASRDPEEILTLGSDHSLFGTQWVTRPYPPFLILGADHSAFGTAFVSTDPQYLFAGAGDQSSLLTSGIDGRLRIRQRSRVQVGAGDQLSTGLAWISPRNREILASAPMPFAPAAPRVCSGVRVDGVDGEFIGEAIADFTEAGKVKRVGAGDQLVTGNVLFSFRISITAGDSSGFGASIAYNSINPIGIDDLVFGSSVVAGNGGHVCGQLPRAIPMPESDFSSIGLAGVSNA